MLAATRKQLESNGIDWYAYDSLANFTQLKRLFDEAGLDSDTMLSGSAVLDVGCADGDFAFALESLGARVTAVDHPRSSQNGMKGVRALKSALGSSLELLEMDIDRSFDLEQRQFDFAFILGVLYHVKNPFYVLETVARHTRYCAVSTRIARYFPQQLTDSPIAYLLSEDELNADNSNFWIFSPAGFSRLLERSHWRVLASFSVGDSVNSRPDTIEHDERIFCLLESTYGMRHIELLDGWHSPEDSGWRWVSSRFSLTAPRSGKLSIELFVPDAIIERFGSITLLSERGRMRYTQPGLHRFETELAEGHTILHTDAALPASANDPRELALIIASVNFD